MPPVGPTLPRKGTGLWPAREAMRVVAEQIGVVVTIERHRKGRLQKGLAREVGIPQTTLSLIENGRPVPTITQDADIDRLFRALGIARSPYASYVKWWRDNAPRRTRRRRKAR